jgi:hypothetical protein
VGHGPVSAAPQRGDPVEFEALVQAQRELIVACRVGQEGQGELRRS